MNERRPPTQRVPGLQVRRPEPHQLYVSGRTRSGPGAGVWIAIGLSAVVGLAVAAVAVGGKKRPFPEPVVTAPPDRTPPPPVPSITPAGWETSPSAPP
ncbi:MAG TPA: hypothetical protein VFS19_05595, partial [Planctomycetota bacterium]|nr:hypothetical protein [Planctomycetota bacterium]